MKLRVFHSDKGDCLLISGAGGGKLMSDGGMRESFVRHVAPNLKAEGTIDLLCISHVDDDHIGGVVELLDNAMAWKVFKHHQAAKDKDFKPPKVPQMPPIKRIWHNAFDDQIGKNAGPVADLLAAMVPVLAEVDDAKLQEAAMESQAIISSNRQAIQVSQRIKSDQLNIPLNESDKLIMVRKDNKTFKFGSLSCRIVAPFEADIKVFRDKWNEWLKTNRETVTKLRAQAKKDADNLTDDVSLLLAPSLAAGTLGDRKAVTPPNLASIMLFIEDGGRKLLLTGDGHADDALKGLNHLGALDANGSIHLDVLKVQHHGSEHNWTKEFGERVTADHYVFCGNGFMTNPERIVLEAIFDARTGGAGPKKKFKFWFNASKESETKQDRIKHMTNVEKWVAAMSKKDPRLESFFLGKTKKADFFDLNLP